MKNHFLNKNIVLILIYLLLSNSLSLSGQAKRTAAPAKTEMLASETNAAMSSAWEKGSLPAPLPVSAGNDDEKIAILAQKVAAKSDESIPALLSALQMSGFFVTGKDGKTILAPDNGKGQGLPINGWEAASMAKMFGDGKKTNLTELSENLKLIPEFSQADISNFLLEGIRQNADQAENRYLRNWARFIIALGKNSDEKYDISQGARAERVTLDAIQHFLIMRRLYGDLFALSQKYDSQSAASYNNFRDEKSSGFVKTRFTSNDNSEFRRINFRNPFQAENFFSKFSQPDETPIPCRMDGLAPIIMDASATILGVGFGQFTGFLEEAFEKTPAAEKIKLFSKITGILNILLAYAKFVQTYASLESKIILEDAPPLIRTKNAAAGERKKLRTEVRVNIGNWQMLNCIRTAMNITTGMDFATLNDGPLGDVSIRWHLDEGGAGDVYSNSSGKTGKEQIVGFTQDGAARIQDANTSAGTGKNAVKDATYVRTDEKGIARIILEGSPQKNFKGANAAPVTKRAKIRTTIKMKAGEIKGDSVDLAGQVIAGVPGLITMPAELLYRMDWASIAELSVPVRDWRDCDGKGWSGTVEVSYQKTENTNKVTKRGENPSDRFYSGQEIRNWSYNYKAVFNINASPGETYESGNTLATLNGNITAEASRITDEKHSWGTKGDCSSIAGINSTSFIDERGKLDAIIDDGTLLIRDNQYKISFLISEIPATRTHRTSVRHRGWCGENKDHDSTDESSISFSVEGITIEAMLDPKNPNQIEGSKSYIDEMGNEVVIRWSLSNCR